MDDLMELMDDLMDGIDGFAACAAIHSFIHSL